jgi:hypothetical protein
MELSEENSYFDLNLFPLVIPEAGGRGVLSLGLAGTTSNSQLCFFIPPKQSNRVEAIPEKRHVKNTALSSFLVFAAQL